MPFQAFRPPLLKNTLSTTTTASNTDLVEPSAKRRRISDDRDYAADGYHPIKSTAVGPPNKPSSVLREPLHTLKNPPSPENAKGGTQTEDSEGHYTVLWRKFTMKKNKTWDGDGMLSVKGGFALLQDEDGKSLGRIRFAGSLLPGSTLSIGGKDVEIDSVVPKDDSLARRSSLGNSKSSAITSSAAPERSAVKLGSGGRLPVQPNLSLRAKLVAARLAESSKKRPVNYVSQANKGMKMAFKNPLKETTILPQIPSEKPIPRHDPAAADALVFKRPSTVSRDRQIVDVVLDPLIAKKLRPHQREGVKFLYECVMGLRGFDGEGCILADEMGLGKTLQTIALLWTLLKQNPIYKAEPVIKKALIVCPVTLISNWQKEFNKWIGKDRIGVYVADGTKTRLTDFTMGKAYSVMIIGYERLRSVAEELTKGSGIDIVIADEGHRLKTVQNKSAQAIQSLNTPKRIILSGTPIQNDLSEFFSMVDFVNDGCLGTYKKFLKNFETPIVKSRQPDAVDDDIELGDARSAELAQITSPFILRRTADILSNYLPPKTEYVLFCNPTKAQARIYREVVASPIFQSALGGGDAVLQLITILKKLCNSPSLLNSNTDDDKETSSASRTALLEMLPAGLIKTFGNHASTKIRILDQLLHQIRSTTDEKVVLVSNYTSTLTLLSTLLTSLGLPFLRLDGSTPASRRQSLVDDFNRSPASNCFAFLLSAKAGGLGLNLIGGSRLILFDVDWNPAVDDQAMARIHREGQRRHCRIYRFLVKGGLEERIWQRQVVKRGLADSIMDGGSSAGTGGSGGDGAGNDKNAVAAFSREELRDLFSLDMSPPLRTHELIRCGCGGSGQALEPEEPAIETKEMNKEEMPFYVEASDASCSGDEDDESLPDMTNLIAASKLSSASIQRHEKRIAAGRHAEQASTLTSKSKAEKQTKSKTQQLQQLMQYAHLDTSAVAGLAADSDELGAVQRAVGDTCLMQVLRQDSDTLAGGVAYVFMKTSRAKAKAEAGLEGALL